VAHQDALNRNRAGINSPVLHASATILQFLRYGRDAKALSMRYFRNILVSALAMSLTAGVHAMESLSVMISGGFSHAYHEVLPEFERGTGVAVTTLSGASQGTGPRTIKSQLERGVDADVVILSKEGLSELIAAGRIVGGSEVELASVPLAAAVRDGSPKPDIANLDAFRRALLNARLVVMPGSTSGLFIKDEVFPRLGISDKVSLKVVARGTDSTAMLASGEADLALGPVSELLNQPGVAVVGSLPDQVQLVQVFTAAIVRNSRHSEQAKRLIQFLTSDRATAAIKSSGMEPVGYLHSR
jgi:molybdate transport system substrate-binding protein